MAQIKLHTRYKEKNLGTTLSAQSSGFFAIRSDKETFAQLRSGLLGLTTHEVESRRAQFGMNMLAERGRNDTLLMVVVRQFRSILILVLCVAAGTSFLLGDALDGQVILAAVCINVIVGTYQEKKASNALASLKKAVITTARARRDGVLVEVLQKDLVPGDIIEVQAGDRVPADIRILDAHDLETNEAVLTGESHPTVKNARDLMSVPVLAEMTNMLFLGTVVTAGRGNGIVVATAGHTEMGRIARLLADTRELRTPLQHQLDLFARRLLSLITAVVLMMFFVGVSKGSTLSEMFATSIAVAVSAIPEGLTIAMTVILALGMQEILKKKGLTRSLLAAETLGATSVICTDKTGTLTTGEMEVVAIETWDEKFENRPTVPAPHSPLHALLTAAVLCNDAEIPGETGKEAPKGNMTDRALMRVAMHAGMDARALRTLSPRTDEIPFNSTTKYMATFHRDHDSMLYFKGAPEILIPHFTRGMTIQGTIAIESHGREILQRRVEELSAKGLRVLCVAERSLPNITHPLKEVHDTLAKLVFLGFVGIQDPLRTEVKGAIAAASRAGITTVMITGDHRLTATAIARDAGLLVKGKEVMDGAELRALTPQELARRVKDIAVYARATPEDKLRIIEAWRSRGAVVAMTGDGVNDAPALKSADIGVALGSGTEVAKESSDLVLLENNFSTITAAIREGRVIFEAIRTVTVYLISNSFSEMLAISASLIFGFPLPLLPAQILWINMVTDSLPALALTREPAAAGIMRERPRPRNEALILREHRWVIAAVSGGLAFFSFSVFYLYGMIFHSLPLARTMAFTVLSISTLCYIFSLRSMKESLFHISFFRNPLLIWSVTASIILQVAVVYAPPLQRMFGTVPLAAADWLLVIAIAVAFVALIEWIKFACRVKK